MTVGNFLVWKQFNEFKAAMSDGILEPRELSLVRYRKLGTRKNIIELERH